MILDEMTNPAMRQRLSALIAARSDVETLSYILGPQRMLEWLHSIAISEDAELAALMPPVPPLELRSLVAAPTVPVFLWSGLRDAEMCVTYMDRHLARASEGAVRVLDFGCGCGRTTRFLQLIGRLNVRGSDVNEKLVEWCRENLSQVRSTLNSFAPPMPLETGCCDFVYSLSIFSHLSERAVHAWLEELARITADNGIVLLTTHGIPAIEILCDSALHQGMFRLTADEARQLRDGFADRQFVYFPYDADIVAAANAGDDYGNTFIHESYIRSQWPSEAFEVVEFVPGGLRGWQDVTILRRKPRRIQDD